MEIGLVVALSLVIVAFTYTPDEYRIQKVAVDVMPVDVDIVPVTTDAPKQKPQKVEVKALSQLIEVIPNHRFVQTDLTFEDFDPDAIVEIVPPAKDEDCGRHDFHYSRDDAIVPGRRPQYVPGVGDAECQVPAGCP